MGADVSFASLAERHLGPVLTSAGFAAGQWAAGQRTSAMSEDGRWVTVVHPWSEGGTYCTGASDYVRRYPDLVAGREDQYGADHSQMCLDIVVEGTLDGGVTSIQVEFEDLADLLRDVGRADDADAVQRAIASADAEHGVQVIAGVLRRLYLPGREPAGDDGRAGTV